MLSSVRQTPRFFGISTWARQLHPAFFKDPSITRITMSFSLDDTSGMDTGMDRELKDFLAMEQKKAQLQSQINRLNDICWDKCVTDKPSSKLDSRTENCLRNCVDRFIDSSLAVAQRFATLISKQQ